MLIVVLNDLRPNFFKKRENTKNEIFEKNFPFLRQRHRFRGGKAETGPRYGNALEWAKGGRFAMRFRDFA